MYIIWMHKVCKHSREVGMTDDRGSEGHASCLRLGKLTMSKAGGERGFLLSRENLTSVVVESGYCCGIGILK